MCKSLILGFISHTFGQKYLISKILFLFLFAYTKEKHRIKRKEMKNQIVITCSEDGAILELKYDESVLELGYDSSLIYLTKGENVLSVTKIPELAYGFIIKGCGQYIESIDLSDYDTSKIWDMSQMFARCSNLKSLDINMDTSNVTNMFGMFSHCDSLEEINFLKFDTSKVNNMGDMFSGCRRLKHLDVSLFNTSNVTYIGHMFEGCNSLETLNVSNFDTSRVSFMDFMFAACYSLKTLNLSNFNTSNVKGMEAMFLDCKSLINLDISNFDFSKTIRKKNIFEGCKEGIGINLNTIKFNPDMIIDDDMKRNGMKYQVGSYYCYKTDTVLGILTVKGVVVYNNGIVAVARVWYGNMEMITSLEEYDYVYTWKQIFGLFNDFTDEHVRHPDEDYLLIDLKTDLLVPRDRGSLYIMD